MKTRQLVSLLSLTAFLLLGCSFTSATEKDKITVSLKEAFKDKFYIGTALNVDQIWSRDKKAIPVIEREFSSIVAENCMKSMYMQPREGVFYFNDADKFVELGEKNNMFIIGHTLIWHSQAPKWFFTDDKGNDVSREVLIERMKTHITTIVSHYKGRIHGWDVVNEAVDDGGSLRESKFLQIIGEDYLQLAFEFARDADPDAELYYNDYSMSNPNKRRGVIRMIKNLQEKGIKIDGIGMQGHVSLEYPSLKSFEESIIAFSQTGAKVMVTEFDMNILPNPKKDVGAEVSLNYAYQKEMNPYADGLSEEKSKEFNKRYVDFFELFLKHQDKISRVTLWGISDKNSWLNDWPMKGRTNYPLLFDRQYNDKPVVQQIISLTDECKLANKTKNK